MASSGDLVPITRDFLASFYDKFPFPPLDAEVLGISSKMRNIVSDLLEPHSSSQDVHLLLEELNSCPPHKIDENMWKNREHMEEIIYLLEVCISTSALQDNENLNHCLINMHKRVQKTMEELEDYQNQNSERVFNAVAMYLPRDFRGSLIRQQRERSERTRKEAIDALISSGGSIRAKYALLWEQQMERRKQLAQLGSATGVYKALVKYLVGVPQVLLDFIRQINDDDGPMEEQRQRYGPPLYNLTTMILLMHLLLLLLKSADISKLFDKVSVLDCAVKIYTKEFERLLKFISEVFAASPFFISAHAINSLETRVGGDYNEITVLAGRTFEVTLPVETVNSDIVWDFSLVQGSLNTVLLSRTESKKIDIGFSVEHVNSDHSGTVNRLVPVRRCNSDKGSFRAFFTGNYKLIWDNSYSKFFKKILRYKVKCMPPVLDDDQNESRR